MKEPSALVSRSPEHSEGETNGDLIARETQPDPQSRVWNMVFFAAMCALVLLFVLMLVRPFFVNIPAGGDHYVYLAHHLIRGDLTVDDLPAGYGDYVAWEGHKYLPFGLLPALVLVPFLPLLDAGVPLISVSHLFTLLNIWLFYSVLGRAGVVRERRKLALLLFFGGTVYSSTILVGYSGNSWFFAQVVAITCVLLAIWEMLGRRRPLLVGLLLGLVGLARLTALFALPFFIWLMWRSNTNADTGAGQNQNQNTVKEKPITRFAGQVALLALGMVGPALLLLAYNYVRFQNPLESGYALSVLYDSTLEKARSYGLFNLVHVPKNLFMLLLQGPVPFPSEDAPVLQFPYFRPSPWGMGILFTSPALVYAFRARLKEPLVQACWLAVVCAMLPTITYYGIGWVQFGYRYALDFLPFLLLLAARGFPDPPTNWVRALVIVSVLVNLWGNFIISFGA